MGLVHIAVHLLRLASEAVFLFELNKVLGALVHGGQRARARAARAAEEELLAHAQSRTRHKRVALPDGTALHTLVAGADGGPVVVLLHGHSMCAALFFAQLDSLCAAGCAVLAPDLPGWGRSSRPRFRGSCAAAGVDYYTRRVLAWMDALRLRDVALVGHSLGAYLAHEVARRRPGLVRSLALAAPAAIARAVPYRCALWFALTPQRLLTHGGLLAAALFGALYPRDECYNRRGVRDIVLCDNSVAAGVGDAAAAAMLTVSHRRFEAQCERPLVDLVQRFPFPVQLIAGDRDVLVALHDVRELHALMLDAGNDARLCVIPGADHSPHISAPDLFAAAIKTVVQTGVAASAKA